MKKYQLSDFIDQMKRLYPESPLPGIEAYRTCILYLEDTSIASPADVSFASPAVEFCEYVYDHQISWFHCSWEKDILPLDYDTTIMPNYIFSTPFLRYYFPMCLHISIRYFFGVYEGREVGNVYSFVEHTVLSMIAHADQLKPEEKQLMMDFCSLMQDNDFYNDEKEYEDLYRALQSVYGHFSC